MKTSRFGFTLLELMIGLVIIAVLAGISVPSFSKSIERTKVKDAETTLAAIHSAEKIYRLDQGKYGTRDNLVTNNYIADPDPDNNNANWDFDAVGGATLTVTATRTGSGYDGKKIVIDETFDGTHYSAAGSNHPLRDP